MGAAGKDDAIDGLLRRTLSRTARGGHEACPEPEILAAYFDRSLSRDEVASCEGHFATCARCREQLAAMVRAGEALHPARQKAWTWDWRWLAVTITVTWEVRHAQQREKSAEQPLVAMSRPEQSPLPPAGPPTAATRAAPAQLAPELTAPANERKDHGAREEVPAETNPVQSEAARAEEALGKKQSSPNSAANAAQQEPSGTSNGTAGASLGGIAGGTIQQQNAPTAPPLLKQEPDVQPALPPNGAAGANNAARPAGRTPARISANAVKVQTTEQRSSAILIRTSDPKILWRITGGGFVERTVDGGATWHGQLPDASAQPTAGAAPSAKVCWLVGNSGVILMTKDTENWKKIPPPIPADFTAVTAKDASSATITAAGGQKFATSDGGKKWKPAQ